MDSQILLSTKKIFFIRKLFKVNWLSSLFKPRATVIIPTFGEARFAHWAIESVRQQTVKNIEIFIICDGSPPEMVTFFQGYAKRDSRIQVLQFPKSERTGEPYRDDVLRKKARGKNVFYCSHDDLWFPDHIAKLEKVLQQAVFAHSILAFVTLDEAATAKQEYLSTILYADLAKEYFRRRMLDQGKMENLFGLSCGAHTRKAYLDLYAGWTVTPAGIWTDLYFWRKFLSQFPQQCRTCKEITVLTFPASLRKDWSAEKREQEIAFYFKKMQDPKFREEL